MQKAGEWKSGLPKAMLATACRGLMKLSGGKGE
jgi:hypothetical protein